MKKILYVFSDNINDYAFKNSLKKEAIKNRYKLTFIEMEQIPEYTNEIYDIAIINISPVIVKNALIFDDYILINIILMNIKSFVHAKQIVFIDYYYEDFMPHIAEQMKKIGSLSNILNFKLKNYLKEKK